jgi:dynein heavy chain
VYFKYSFNRPGVEIDKQFRLFLSSKSDNSFPVSLLKAGIKMTIEAPRGLKNNLRQNFGPGGIVSKKTFESTEYGKLFK